MMYILISLISLMFGTLLGALIAFPTIDIVLTNKKNNEAVEAKTTKKKKKTERGAILEPKKELSEIYDQFFSE